MRQIYFEKSLGIDIRDNSFCLALLGKTWNSYDILASRFFEMEPLTEEKKTTENKFLENMFISI